MSEENERKNKVFYQHGQKVAKDARHKVNGPMIGDTSDEQYTPADLMSALFYMHHQTIAAVASEFSESDDFDDETLGKITSILNTVRGSFNKTKNKNEQPVSEGDS